MALDVFCSICGRCDGHDIQPRTHLCDLLALSNRRRIILVILSKLNSRIVNVIYHRSERRFLQRFPIFLLFYTGPECAKLQLPSIALVYFIGCRIIEVFNSPSQFHIPCRLPRTIQLKHLVEEIMLYIRKNRLRHYTLTFQCILAGL